MQATEALRHLPSVHEILTQLSEFGARYPHALVVREIRRVLDAEREKVLRGGSLLPIVAFTDLVRTRLGFLETPSLRHVINATGVVLHTNLGRAPLGGWTPLSGYSNLEYDVPAGKRGRRDSHVGPLLEALLDRPGIAVNNGAAATFLALNEFAAGYEVVVSRGELIEIGDGFRIPDILTRSGAILREVGTTNRTTVEDYREAIGERTRLLLRVHPSNFHMAGFTAKPSLEALAELARSRGIPLYEDLGSGNVVDLRLYGIDEPRVAGSLQAGVNLVSFSGDKLLGGPQAGILAGDPELVQRLRRNPLFRALRLDKLIHQALERTLRSLVFERWDEIPALHMIRLSAVDIEERAKRLFPKFELVPGGSVIGGGSTPDQNIPTTLVVVCRERLRHKEQQLRNGLVPVIARVVDEALVLDLRTVFADEEEQLAEAVRAVR